MRRRSPTRGRLIWAAVVVAALGAALLLGPSESDGPPLDPSSTGRRGTKALVDTLRELGADVTVQHGPPDPGASAVLLLADELSDSQRRALADWTQAGGTLVLADVSSPLHPAASGGRPAAIGVFEPHLERRCDVPALRRVGRVVVPDAVLMSVPPGATGCFSLGRDSWLLVLPAGRGTVVALGGAGAFTNSQLGKADNALLAADLLAPTGQAHVTVLWRLPAGSGREGLVDLVPTGVKVALAQLGVAFLVVAWWRGRRLGRPVIEAQPVTIDGSESVAAVGRLLQRARGRSQAASILRDDLRRTLAVRLGLPADAPPDQVAAAVSSASGIPRDRVLHIFRGAAPVSEDALVALAQSVESLRREVVHGS